MAELRMTTTPHEWEALRRDTKNEPGARWRFFGDDGFELEGRLTHVPAIAVEAWESTHAVFIGSEEIGKPVVIGHIRGWVRLEK